MERPSAARRVSRKTNYGIIHLRTSTIHSPSHHRRRRSVFITGGLCFQKFMGMDIWKKVQHHRRHRV